MPEVDGSGERPGGVATVNFRLFVAAENVFFENVLNFNATRLFRGFIT